MLPCCCLPDFVLTSFVFVCVRVCVYVGMRERAINAIALCRGEPPLHYAHMCMYR